MESQVLKHQGAQVHLLRKYWAWPLHALSCPLPTGRREAVKVQDGVSRAERKLEHAPHPRGC